MLTVRPVTLERYLAFRIFIAVGVLGSVSVSQIVAQEVFHIHPLYLLIVYVLSYSLLSTFAYLWLGARDWLFGLQFVFDLSSITLLTYITGAYRSPLSLFYVLFIAVSGLMLDRKRLLRLAGTAGVFYGLMTLGVLGRWFPPYPSTWFPIDIDPWRPALYNLTLHLVGFMLTAWLVSIPIESARRSQAQASEEHRKRQNIQNVLHFVIQQFPAGLLLTDAQGQIVFLNVRAEEVLHQSSENEVPWWERLGIPFDWTTLNKESFWRFRLTVGERTFDVMAQRLNPWSSAPIRWLWILQDVTEELKQQDRQRTHERAMAIAQMAAGLAHEIKNPLTAIHASVQLLSQQPDGERQELLQILERETHRLKDVVDHFLQLASPPPRVLRRFAVTEAIETVRRLVEMAPHSNAIRWVVDVMPDTLTLVADENQFRQVLWNLVTNAIKVMPQGGTIRIKARQEGTWMRLSVEDTGPGIPPERLRQLFQPFQPSTTGGLGLGLAIVYNIVQSHGGYIEVQSQPGQGTRFDIWLPLDAS